MDPTLHAWLALLVRWAHFVLGAAWIGTSFYFVWLNNHVRKPDRDVVEPGVDKELWAVHGGGFYLVSKFAIAPPKMPGTLHWFKWEAYLTWVTGFLLLILIYYLEAATWMVDPGVSALSPAQAVGVGLGVLALGWLIYDGLCRSRLGSHPRLLAAVGYAGFVAVAWGLGQLLAPRAAYIHLGALLGTIMAANVFFVIIPFQRGMVREMEAGRLPDPTLGDRAAQRSLHNNYLTLPALFLMVSNHSAMTYGHPQAWAVVAAIALIGAAVRHWFNVRGRGERNAWLLPASAVGIVGLILVTRPPPAAPAGAAAGSGVAFPVVQAIVQARCTPCHASRPTQPGFAAPPAGIRLESPELIRALAPRIKATAVDARTMPQGNLTGITEEERAVLGRWASEGAR